MFVVIIQANKGIETIEYTLQLIYQHEHKLRENIQIWNEKDVGLGGIWNRSINN